MNFPTKKEDTRPSITVGTTPTIVVKPKQAVDLTQAEHVYATLRQEKVKIRKSGEDIEVDAQGVRFTLQQEDTTKLKPGYEAKLQLNWTYDDGKRGATKPIAFIVEENMEEEVLE